MRSSSAELCAPFCQDTASQRELSAMKFGRSMLAGASFLALSFISALAQQVTGVPGSPGATTTIDGKQLPPPHSAYAKIRRNSNSRRVFLILHVALKVPITSNYRNL